MRSARSRNARRHVRNARTGRQPSGHPRRQHHGRDWDSDPARDGYQNEVAAASTEQSEGIEQVNLAIGQVDEVTQQNAALVEQAETAAAAMEGQAEQLRQDVVVCKLAQACVSE